jgi:hypothetical protein
MIAVAASAAAALLYFSSHRGGKGLAAESRSENEREKGTPRPTDDLRALKAQVAFLTTQVSQLRAELAERTGAPPEPAPGPPADAPSKPSAAEVVQAEAGQWHELMARTETDFQAEPRDPRWASDTSAEMHAAVMERAALRAVFQSVDCRSTTCRLEMTDSPARDFSKQLRTLVMRVGPKLPTMMAEHHTRPDGTKTTVYYFTKDP